MKKSYFVAIIAFFLFGCQGIIHNKDVSTLPQKSSKFSVVTSFYPLAFLTKNIVGKKGGVINLAGNNDPHDYLLSPQDMVKLNDADLIVVQGAMLEPWVNNVLPELKQKGKTVLEVSHDLPLVKRDEYENHEAFDPHTWLDPVLAQQMIDAITTSLKNVDPSNNDFYQKNANQLKQQFVKLDNAYKTGLSHCKRTEIITSHDALGYLASRYGLQTHPIAGLSTQDLPSAHTLAKLQEDAVKKGITHILTEQSSVTRFAKTLSKEIGLKMLPFSTLERGTLDPSKNFFDVMNDNLRSLKTSLGCQSSK